MHDCSNQGQVIKQGLARYPINDPRRLRFKIFDGPRESCMLVCSLRCLIVNRLISTPLVDTLPVLGPVYQNNAKARFCFNK
jgi:hypothetical protein